MFLMKIQVFGMFHYAFISGSNSLKNPYHMKDSTEFIHRLEQRTLWLTSNFFFVMKALQPYKTSVIIYQSTQYNSSEDLNLQEHHCENCKSLIFVTNMKQNLWVFIASFVLHCKFKMSEHKILGPTLHCCTPVSQKTETKTYRCCWNCSQFHSN
jgi:hypothetical protein